MPFATASNLKGRVTLKTVPASNVDSLSYTVKNESLNREMSPHLTIYKFQLTSVLSITHRITGSILNLHFNLIYYLLHLTIIVNLFAGIALCGASTSIAAAALVLPHDFSYYVTALESLQIDNYVLASIKFSVALITAYHTLNGVRHLCWDNGKFLDLKQVYLTGGAVLGLSVVSALALAAL